MRYIDKAAVVAEIERRKRKLLDHIICESDKEWVVRTAHQFNRIIMFIDTLEVKEVDKEPTSNDLEADYNSNLNTKKENKVMAKYIDKAVAVAEIERKMNLCKKILLRSRTQQDKEYHQGNIEAYEVTISLLDTLEVKEEVTTTDAFFKKAKEAFCKATCNGLPPRSTCTSLGTCKEYDNFVKLLKRE